ncbi:uncharacterized protein LOC122079541 [Macadamia integrifolia]|uniref:uncharacterized protein LOC122079541 n=1 Tax=Macadamia integrifolia TaxID=60698 RepID=UPI001C5019DE|nr:uncharacterized protein LOC122079541 [Macadamia integrifolia]
MSYKEIKRHDKAIILDGPTPLPIYNLNHTTRPLPVSSSSQGQISSLGAQVSWRLPREEDLELRLGSTGQILSSIRTPYKEINKEDKAILLPKPIPRPTPKANYNLNHVCCL